MALAGTSRGCSKGAMIMSVSSRWLYVLLHHIAVLRRSSRAPVSFLRRSLHNRAIQEALLQFSQCERIWSTYPTVVSQRGFGSKMFVASGGYASPAKSLPLAAVCCLSDHCCLSTSVLRPNSKCVVMNTSTLCERTLSLFTGA